MDNLAHGLVGAALGRAVAGRRVPRAAWLGAFAANVPDLAEFLRPRDLSWPAYLVWHRGITHSLLGAAVEIATLTLLAAVLFRWWARRGEPAPSAWWLLLLFATTVASHLYMDWQGSYGLRPFLPWSNRWYYGDWVAIVDPFYWLVPLVALAWGAERHWRPLAAVLLVVAVTTAILLMHADKAPWIIWAWGALVVTGGIGWVQHWYGVAGGRRAATLALAVLAAYALAQAAVDVPIKAALGREARARFGADARWATLTVAGWPFTWVKVMAGPDSVAGRDWAMPRHLADPAVARALATPRGHAIGQFARFLVAEVRATGRDTVVLLSDARHGRRGGWAAVTVSRP